MSIDKINPSHYKSAAGLEVIDVIEAFDLDFCRGNAVKYLCRAGRKDGEAELVELRKARWYIERAIAQLEKADLVEDEELPPEVERQQVSWAECAATCFTLRCGRPCGIMGKHGGHYCHGCRGHVGGMTERGHGAP
jgi:hypothetical protein